MASEAVKWFPLEVHMDDSLELIEAEFGMTGFGVIIKLYQKIYGGSGYYCNWNDDIALLFAKKAYISINEFNNILEAALNRGILDRELFKKHSVLTSKEIQEKYFAAIKRRKKVEIIDEYLLIDLSEEKHDVDNSQENVDILKENADIFQQRREEESIAEKSKEEKSKEDNSIAEERVAETTSAALDYYMAKINDNPSPAVYTDLSSYLLKGMTDEAIKAIIDYCVAKDRTGWDYIRACIKGNYEDGVRTVEDFNRNHSSYVQQKEPVSPEKLQPKYQSAAPPKPEASKYTKPKSSFHNFEQRSLNIEEIEAEAFASLHSGNEYTEEELEMIKRGDAIALLKSRKIAQEKAEIGNQLTDDDWQTADDDDWLTDSDEED